MIVKGGWGGYNLKIWNIYSTFCIEVEKTHTAILTRGGSKIYVFVFPLKYSNFFAEKLIINTKFRFERTNIQNCHDNISAATLLFLRCLCCLIGGAVFCLSCYITTKNWCLPLQLDFLFVPPPPPGMIVKIGNICTTNDWTCTIFIQ